MLDKVTISSDSVDMTEALEALIKSQAERIGKFYPKPFEIKARLVGPSNHHQKGGTYKALLKLIVPGRTFAISHQEGSTPEAAVHEGFAAAQRVLEDHARIVRGDVKRHQVNQAES